MNVMKKRVVRVCTAIRVDEKETCICNELSKEKEKDLDHPIAKKLVVVLLCFLLDVDVSSYAEKDYLIGKMSYDNQGSCM